MLLNDFLKRAIDIIGSMIGLLILSPVFLTIGIGIKRDSEGPVFYRGSRAAKGGKKFQILKFRTMFEKPESYHGAKITGKNDPRITKFGRWLRETKLNELPQLWNILKGEMSLVGPRPEDYFIAYTWSEEVREEILSVRPGVTSPASVLYRNEESLLLTNQVMNTYINSILPNKVRLDQLYVRNRSILLDFDVLLSTFMILLPKLEAYDPHEERLFWGPISRLMRRYMSWFTIDALVAFAAFGLTGIFWRTFGPLHIGWGNAILLAVGFSLLFSLTGAIIGVQRIDWMRATATDVWDLIPAATLAGILGYGLNSIFNIFPGGLVIIASVFSFSGFVGVRYRSRLVTGFVSRLLSFGEGARVARERVLIIGSGDAGQFAAWFLNNSQDSKAFYVVGFIDDDFYKQGVRIRGVNVLGQREDIQEVVSSNDVGIIVFAIHNISEDERVKILKICEQTTAHVIMLPDFLGALNIISTQNKTRTPFINQDASENKRNELNINVPNSFVIQLNEWLSELENDANAGDIGAIKNKLRLLREMLKDSESVMDISDVERMK